MRASLFEHADGKQRDALQVSPGADVTRGESGGVALGAVEAVTFASVSDSRQSSRATRRASPGIPSMVTNSTAHLL
ncbi:Uncharacterised protein [Mycobacteroides abscessus subsp. massiliense]|nr:Uncharacterised protein [Mycobacteroides abscessus subsp. massiliense]